MKRVSYRLSAYSSDLFGVASALFELGGLTVIHDASGCNSTYTTHDEPRWYDMDSMVYISALTESDAVMGNDKKIIDDIIRTAKESKPKFIALTSSPLPMIMGTDFKGIARLIQKHTGIETMGFNTNGMNTYDAGISESLAELALRFCKNSDSSNSPRDNSASASTSSAKKINLLGITPLDFSINGNAEALKKYYKSQGYEVLSTWAMGNTLEELIYGAQNADLNIAVTLAGIKTARVLKSIYGTPFITECPIGKNFTSFYKKENNTSRPRPGKKIRNEKVVIIGEGLISLELKACLIKDFGFNDIKIISPLKLAGQIFEDNINLTDKEFLSKSDYFITDEEEDIAQISQNADIIIADPLYNRICTYGKKASEIKTRFISFPHDAYSGRIFHDELPEFIFDGTDNWLKDYLGEAE